jgi:hypothetical protein
MWPPRSPNPSLPDIYLWEFLKDSVYKINPRTSEDREQSTEACILRMTQATLRRVASSMQERVNPCITEGDCHF